MNITVCIITRNRLESLALAISSVEKQRKKACEIIVVDNSTSNDTESYIARNYPGIVYIRCGSGLAGQPVMRNMAIKVAKGEVIAFIDDDGYPEPEWLDAILECYMDPKVGAAGGRIIQGAETRPYVNGKCVVGYWDFFRGPVGNFNADTGGIVEVSHLQGTNMTFRTELLTGVGGFDPYLAKGYAAFEDTDAVLAIHGRGYKVVFNPKAVVAHGLLKREGHIGRKIGEKVSTAYSYGRNHAYIVIKHGGITLSSLLQAGFIGAAVDAKRCMSAFPMGIVSVIGNLSGRIIGTVAGISRRMSLRPFDARQ